MTIETVHATTTFAKPLDGHRRGSVLILPGRSEGATAYDRVGAALAWAGYEVRSLGAGADVDEAAAALGDLTIDRCYPRVVLGSDIGALTAIRLARTPGVALDAVVLAGLPGPLDRGDTDAGPGTVATLVVHGELDRESPSLAARSLTAGWLATRFITVADSGHDVLHGIHHRSVALEITQFLETVRAGKHPLRVSIRSTW